MRFSPGCSCCGWRCPAVCNRSFPAKLYLEVNAACLMAIGTVIEMDYVGLEDLGFGDTAPAWVGYLPSPCGAGVYARNVFYLRIVCSAGPPPVTNFQLFLGDYDGSTIPPPTPFIATHATDDFVGYNILWRFYDCTDLEPLDITTSLVTTGLFPVPNVGYCCAPSFNTATLGSVTLTE